MPAIGDLDWGDEMNDNTEMVESSLVQVLKGNQVASGLVASDGGGLQVDYTAGTVVVNATEYSITASNKTCTGAQKNWLYVDSAGAVQISTMAPSGQFAMIAMVDAAASSIERIADMRNLAESILALDIDYAPDNYTLDTGESSEIEQHLAGIDNQIGFMAGFENKIINGDFSEWQRGDGSFTSNGYTADQWRAVTSGSTYTLYRSAFALGQTDVPGEPKNYLTMTVTSSAGASNYAYLQTPLEDVRTLAGQTATFSLYAKADASKNIAIEFLQYFGTGGTPSANVTAIGVTTLALTTSWQRFDATVNIPSISGKTIGTDENTSYLAMRIWMDAGSDYNSRTNSLGQQSGTFNLALVQLEAGETATPFDQRPLSVELILCQRYYQSCFIWGHVCSVWTNTLYTTLRLPVTMRATPALSTASVECLVFGNWTTPTSVLLGTSDRDIVNIKASGNLGSLTNYYSHLMNGYIYLTAEL
jgi:hypothetical protein